MDVFDLRARISLDTSEYDRGLDESSNKSNSFASKLQGGMAKAGKALKVGFVASTAAIGAFAGTSVKTGMEFDSAMSQVAATMGKTTDEIENLRDFAKKMGSETSFSATQSAEALA